MSPVPSWGTHLMTSPDPNHLPKAPSPGNTLGVRVSTNVFGGHTIQSSAHQLWRIPEKFRGDSAGVGAQCHLFSRLPGLWGSQKGAQRMWKRHWSSSAGVHGGGLCSLGGAGPFRASWAGRGVGSVTWKRRVSHLEAIALANASLGAFISAAVCAAPTHWAPGEAVL